MAEQEESAALIARAAATHRLTEAELVELLGDAAATEQQAAAADRVRHD